MSASEGHPAVTVSIRRISTLQDTHRGVLVRAIENICSTENAQMVCAQILDGVPTLPLLDGGQPPRMLPRSHPSRTEHQSLCPGVLEQLAQFRKDFDVTNLPLDSEALLAYQSAAPGSRLFNTRLIELASRAIHQIAVEINALDSRYHDDDIFSNWVPPKSDTVFWRRSPSGPLPTWLHMDWYKDYETYPNGPADMIGYWAENFIIGGVLLFDRREPGSAIDDLAPDVDPDAVYIHAEREMVTYRICKLHETQKKAYLDFLLAEDASPACPLPLGTDESNENRVDPEESILDTGIYRDSWERLPLPDGAGDARLRDVISKFDYPHYKDWVSSHARANKRRYGEDDSELDD